MELQGESANAAGLAASAAVEGVEVLAVPIGDEVLEQSPVKYNGLIDVRELEQQALMMYGREVGSPE